MFGKIEYRVLMQKAAKNKQVEKADEKDTDVETKRPYSFPAAGVVIKASSLAEAVRLLERRRQNGDDN